MKIKCPRILCLARGDMINITTLQDPLYPLSKFACHLLQTCLPGLHGLSGSYLNASAQALSPEHTVLFSLQLHPPKLTLPLQLHIQQKGIHYHFMRYSSPSSELTYTLLVNAFIYSFTQKCYILPIWEICGHLVITSCCLVL